MKDIYKSVKWLSINFTIGSLITGLVWFGLILFGLVKVGIGFGFSVRAFTKDLTSLRRETAPTLSFSTLHQAKKEFCERVRERERCKLSRKFLLQPPSFAVLGFVFLFPL